ncbi:MAG: GNAT family N-acetyltransferase [Dehalococcoidia bacterium]|nr:GNAT family N-acetyltransferase [Dehalococcoidia bacterium]
MNRLGFKYVTMIVYERSLDSEIPTVITKVPAEIKVLSKEDISSELFQGVILTSDDDGYSHQEALRKISEGDICLVVSVNNKPAGFGWIYTQKVKYEELFEAEIRLADSESLMYDRLVFPEFRRMGLGEKINEERLRLAQSMGFKKMLAYVEIDNVPSVKSIEALGFRKTKSVSCMRLFSLRKVFEKPISTRD